MPLDWATTLSNLGDALIRIGKRRERSSEVEEGRSAIAAAWKEYKAGGYLQYDDYFAEKVAEADRILAEIRNKP